MDMFQDRLIGSLIGLARATDGNEHLISDSSTAVILEALSASNTDGETLEKLRQRIIGEKRKMVPDCFVCASPCGRTSDYDMRKLWTADEDIRSLKSQILLGIRDMAPRVFRAAAQGYRDREVEEFFYKALIVIGMDDYGVEDLNPILLEMGKMNLRSMGFPQEG